MSFLFVNRLSYQVGVEFVFEIAKTVLHLLGSGVRRREREPPAARKGRHRLTATPQGSEQFLLTALQCRNTGRDLGHFAMENSEN